MNPDLSAFYELKNYFSDITISIGESFIPDHNGDHESYYQAELQELENIKLGKHKPIKYEVKRKKTCVLINGHHYLNDYVIMHECFDEFDKELMNNVSSRSLKEEIPEFIKELIEYFKNLLNGFKQNEETDTSGKIITFYTNDNFNNEYLNSDKYNKSYRDDISHYLKIKVEHLRNILDKLLEIQEDPASYLTKSLEQEYKSPLYWKKGPTYLVELIIALFESKSITNQTEDLIISEAYNIFESIFNIKLEQPSSTLSHHKHIKRNSAPFLTKLRESYLSYIEKN